MANEDAPAECPECREGRHEDCTTMDSCCCPEREVAALKAENADLKKDYEVRYNLWADAMERLGTMEARAERAEAALENVRLLYNRADWRAYLRTPHRAEIYEPDWEDLRAALQQAVITAAAVPLDTAKRLLDSEAEARVLRTATLDLLDAIDSHIIGPKHGDGCRGPDGLVRAAVKARDTMAKKGEKGAKTDG